MRRFAYESWGIRPAINAHAFMTPIGGSIMPADVDEDPTLHKGPTAVIKGGGLWRGVSLREALEQKALCDVFFDSFWLGIQGSGLEAGAMQIPVIAGDEDVRTLYTKEFGGIPYEFANEGGELAALIERMAYDADYRSRSATQVAHYVSQVHDYASVGHRFEASIAKWTGRTTVFTETF